MKRVAGYYCKETNRTLISKTCLDIYTVKLGDTLSEIAKAKHTIGDIMRANPKQIGNRNLIYPGQKLIIPKGVNQSVPTAQKTPAANKPKQPANWIRHCGYVS
ncbi:MAG: LysM peptidoglycan-binding domain-containing protein [Acidobacteria bacterium]|nr:LysM peptidoglycan-binding domain-containing protein [Acidobacteriota bacterium]